MDQFRQMFALLGSNAARAVDAELHRPRNFWEGFVLTPDQVAGQRIMRGLRMLATAAVAAAAAAATADRAADVDTEWTVVDPAVDAIADGASYLTLHKVGPLRWWSLRQPEDAA